MSDLGTIGGVVLAVSACASGVCVAIAYHVPARLRDGVAFIGDALLQIDADEDRATDPTATRGGD